MGPLSLTQIHMHLFHRNFLAYSAKRESRKQSYAATLCLRKWQTATGCHANSGSYDKGKLSVYDKVAKSAEARKQLSKCGNSLDIEEEAIVSSLALLSMGTR